MAEIAKCFIGPVLLSASAATLLTVDVDHRAHLLDLHVFNNHTAAVNLTLSMGTDAAGTRLYDAMPIPAKTSYYKNGLVVVEPLATVQGFASLANKLNIEWSGVEAPIL